MRIAVVGGGIAGLGAAWLLAPRHDVHLFERARRLGGHTHTHPVDASGRRLALDTGFIVYNEHTYPLLTQLFDQLGVESQATNMSFSVQCERCSLLYSGLGSSGVFADPKNAIRPGFLGFLTAIHRFHHEGRSEELAQRLHLDNGRTATRLTLEEWVGTSGSDQLGRHYVFPLASALWSTGIPDIRSFPAAMFVDFFRKHRLFQIRGRLEWRSLVGGSKTYVDAMQKRLAGRTHTGAAVRAVERQSGEVRLHFGDGSSQSFDRVVLATHAPEALRLLLTPTDREKELLGAWRYAESDTWLHGDPRFLARTPRAQASWNYQLTDCRDPHAGPTMTYNLNRLQNLDAESPCLVTLNPKDEPHDAWARMTYEHPIYTPESWSTQGEITAMNGQNETFFAGAYLGFGFHEDAFRSAVDVAEQIGV